MRFINIHIIVLYNTYYIDIHCMYKCHSLHISTYCIFEIFNGRRYLACIQILFFSSYFSFIKNYFSFIKLNECVKKCCFYLINHFNFKVPVNSFNRHLSEIEEIWILRIQLLWVVLNSCFVNLNVKKWNKKQK